MIWNKLNVNIDAATLKDHSQSISIPFCVAAIKQKLANVIYSEQPQVFDNFSQFGGLKS